MSLWWYLAVKGYRLGTDSYICMWFSGLFEFLLEVFIVVMLLK